MLTSLLQNTIFNENTPGLYEAGVKLLPSPYRSEYDNSELDNINMGRNNLLYYANGGNLSRTLSNVALGVTNQMRSSLGSTNVTGTATYTIVYIKVVWPWLIYSAVLIVAATALLGLTIWLSHGEDRMVWKSSSLALLFHGLPESETDGRLLTTANMETGANKILTKLSKDETGNVKLKTL
jgi:hypothetical protein